MKNRILFLNISLFFLAALLLAAAYVVNVNNEKPLMNITKQDQSINFNASLYTYINLGLKRLISSTLWVSTIIESDIDHYKKKDLNSWMFLRFNSISILEPKFYENYSFGGIYLSIIKDDLKGASLIYDHGLKQYENDFTLLRDAGFHFYFEVQDYKRAYEIYSKLKNHPQASSLIISTLARLEKDFGNPEEAFTLLLNKYEQLQDKNSFLAKKIRSHLYALKAEQDLNCLNSKDKSKKTCSTVDLDGNAYIILNGSYCAQERWEPFKIKKKNN